MVTAAPEFRDAGGENIVNAFVSLLTPSQTSEVNQVIKTKDLFWLTVLEVLIHNRLALLLGVRGRRQVLWEHWGPRACHLLAGKQTEGKSRKGEERQTPSRASSRWPRQPPLILPPPSGALLRTKTLTQGLWGHRNPTHSSLYDIILLAWKKIQDSFWHLIIALGRWQLPFSNSGQNDFAIAPFCHMRALRRSRLRSTLREFTMWEPKTKPPKNSKPLSFQVSLITDLPGLNIM